MFCFPMKDLVLGSELRRLFGPSEVSVNEPRSCDQYLCTLVRTLLSYFHTFIFKLTLLIQIDQIDLTKAIHLRYRPFWKWLNVLFICLFIVCLPSRAPVWLLGRICLEQWLTHSACLFNNYLVNELS